MCFTNNTLIKLVSELVKEKKNAHRPFERACTTAIIQEAKSVVDWMAV